MSNIYFECELTQADPYLASTNLDGTLKKPLNWSLSENSEVANRYNQDTNGDHRIYLRWSEVVQLKFQTKDYSGSKSPVLKVDVELISADAVGDVHVRCSATNFYVVEVPTNVKHTIEVELEANSEYLRISQPEELNTMNVYQALTITYQTDPIEIINEFVKYNIKTNLVDAITIGNTVHQRKTGKTITSFSNEAIIEPSENKQINDVLNFARLNKSITTLWIDDVGNAGESLANLPQQGGYQKYYFNTETSNMKTGLYNDININYQIDPLNGVY